MAKASVKGLTIVTYGRVAIWLALLFIAGGFALQSVQINMLTQSDVDSVYAKAVASQAALGLRTRLEDTRRMQLAASQHPRTVAAIGPLATNSADIETTPDNWFDTLQLLLPGAETIELLTARDVRGLQSRYNFAVQDLVNRTLRGDDMKLEAVNIDGQQSFFWASPVSVDPRMVQGVLLVRYGSDWLQAFRSTVADDLGQIKVMQKLSPLEQSGIQVFTAGQPPARPITPVTVPINNYWFLTYTPSDQRPVLSLFSLSFPWILTLCLTLGALFAVLYVQTRVLNKNRRHFQQFIERYFKEEISEPQPFKLRLFNELAEDVTLAGDELMQKLHAARAAAKAHAAKEPTKERIQRDDLPELDEPEDESDTIEEDDHIVEYDGNSGPGLPEHIFRAYDIRGLVGKELTDDTVYGIGRALGSQVRERGFERINLAWDGRLSSEHLAKQLQRGLLESGCSVNRLGMLPTGALYYATHELDTPCGVMVTGSHNPAQYNGFKAVIDQQPLTEKEIQDIAARIRVEDYTNGYAGVREDDIRDRYLARIEEDIQINRDLHIVIDAGNGVAGPFAAELFRNMGIEVTELYCDIDGNFPNHHPDPGEPENLEDLKNAVLVNQADLGLAFDGDGDRVILIDNEGNTIWPDRMMMLLIEDILPRRPGADILFDVKSSRHLAPMINRLGGRPTMWKTGHSLMKRKLKETKAAMGGEFSGHFYIAERWYGFDDGLYAGARLLEILATRNGTVADVFRALPADVSTPELTIETTEAKKFPLIKALSEDADLTAEGRVFKTDGLRIEFNDGWGLIRASNTTPRLTLRFAGESEETIARIQQLMKQALTRHAPEIKTPF